MSKSDTTPRFTEADLRKAHKAGYKKRVRQVASYNGGYRASFWDFEKLRAELGLMPESTKRKVGIR
jgi:hypothetical protein